MQFEFVATFNLHSLTLNIVFSFVSVNYIALCTTNIVQYPSNWWNYGQKNNLLCKLDAINMLSYWNALINQTQLMLQYLNSEGKYTLSIDNAWSDRKSVMPCFPFYLHVIRWWLETSS